MDIISFINIISIIIIIGILKITFMGRFMKAELVGAKTVQGPAEKSNIC